MNLYTLQTIFSLVAFVLFVDTCIHFGVTYHSISQINFTQIDSIKKFFRHLCLAILSGFFSLFSMALSIRFLIKSK